MDAEMIPFAIVISALILYPVFAWLIFKFTSSRLKLRSSIVRIVLSLCVIIIAAMFLNFITLSETANWILATYLYLPLLVILRLSQYCPAKAIATTGAIIITIVQFLGGLIAIPGFVFVFIFTVDLSVDCIRHPAGNLLYMENNIGGGPDPSERLKQIDIYQTTSIIPFLAYRINTKTYDEWSFPLQPCLDLEISQDKKTLYLKSYVDGYKIFKTADTIKLR